MSAPSVDLRTTYLGLALKNPLVASASPLWRQVSAARQAEDAGAAAIVLYSLFEEQITRESHDLDRYLHHGVESFPEALSFFPDLPYGHLLPDANLEQIARIKRAVAIPVVGSLNGTSPGAWLDYAHAIEQAGADALELNLYYLATDPDQTGATLEDAYVQMVREVRERIRIPLAVKLHPFFTSLPAMARRLAGAGADGLVLFNRFYQPDLDLETLEVVPRLQLSTSRDLHLPLRWIAILYGRVPADFALTGGVHTAEDALKAVMAGASVAMLTSEILAHGIPRLGEILRDLEAWLVEHEYTAVTQMQGSMSQRSVADPVAFERTSYVNIVGAYDYAPLARLRHSGPIN